MNLLLRILSLGLFAATGVAIAVCVAVSSVPEPKSPFAPRKSDFSRSEKRPSLDVAQGPKKDPSDPPLEPVIVEPEPPVTQLSVKEAQELVESGGKGIDIQKIMDLAKTIGGVPEGVTPEGRLIEEPSTGPPSPAASAPGAPAASSEPKTIITKAPGEGDSGLSMVIQGEDLRKVLELLSEQGGLNILASTSVQGTVSATLNDVDVPTALDAILKSTGYVWRRDGKFIYVGTPQDFKTMRQSQDHIATRLYRPNYVTAAELEKLISPLLTQGVGFISVNTPAAIGIAADANQVGGDGFAGQEAVLVRDYEAVLVEVDQIVDQIDRRPTQVQIEAMILSVRLDDTNELGVDFEVLRNQGALRLVSGNPLSDLANLSVDSGGLKVGFLDSNLALFVNALEVIGDTNVIATPRLMCLNKHRAEIHIGSELGYLSTTTTETASTQTVEFLQVGTQLRLRPFISSDGLIRMEVHPELSTGVVADGIPNKETTQVTTNVMVPDGRTVVIGGLMRDELTSNVTQIPFFGSLPYVGWAFGYNIEETSRQEILVLVTPRIVYEPEACCEGEGIASEFHHRQMLYADKMNPLGRRYLGRKYFRLAGEAWAAGDRDRAMRLINHAIHFDPLNRAAIDLRADIVSGQPYGDHTAPSTQVQPPLDAPLDGEELPPWLFERLVEEPGPPHHPLDPGRPGERHDIYAPTPPEVE